MIKTLLLLAIISFTQSCGHQNQDNDPTVSQTESAGSWSTMVGGTMMKWQQPFFNDVESVTFYKVFMPVGLGVVHEFIGVKATLSNGQTKLSTSGLVGDADDAYFKRHIANTRIAKTIRTNVRPLHAERIIRSINQHMRQSKYNNQAVYVTAMTMTPLLGRPCAKVAKSLEKFIRNY